MSKLFIFALLSACTGSVDGTYAMTVQQVRSFDCAPRPPGWNADSPVDTFTLELHGTTVTDPSSFSCTGTWANGGTDLECMIPDGGTDAAGAPCTDMIMLTVRTSGERIDPPGQLADGEIEMWLNGFPDFYATGTR